MHKKFLISLSFVLMMLFAGLATAAETVNINKASAAAIQQNLVGIGPIKAEAIVSYRKKNGKFKSLDDLENVTGLGPALVKKNKRLLSLTKGVTTGDDKAYAAAKKSAGKAKSTSSKKSTKKQTAKKSDSKSDTSKSTSKTTAKPAKKSDSKTTKSKSTKSKSTKSKSKKSAKVNCSSKTLSKTDKKACADKKTKKKPAKKKKKKKTSKSTT